MNQSFHLYQLQKIDNQIDAIENRLVEIERIFSNDKRIKQASALFENARAVLTSSQQALADAEAAVAAKRIKIEQSEAALYGGSVRTPKELQDLQIEIASLKKRKSQLEDAQLEVMVKCEEAEARVKTVEQNLAKTQEDVAIANASLNAEHTQLKKNREKLAVERNAVLSQVDPESQAIYTKLRSQKKGVVIATIVEDGCSVCGSEISPADRQAARSPSKIVYCSFCGRIIYSG